MKCKYLVFCSSFCLEVLLSLCVVCVQFYLFIYFYHFLFACWFRVLLLFSCFGLGFLAFQPSNTSGSHFPVNDSALTRVQIVLSGAESGSTRFEMHPGYLCSLSGLTRPDKSGSNSSVCRLCRSYCRKCLQYFIRINTLVGLTLPAGRQIHITFSNGCVRTLVSRSIK